MKDNPNCHGHELARLTALERENAKLRARLSGLRKRMNYQTKDLSRLVNVTCSFGGGAVRDGILFTYSGRVSCGPVRPVAATRRAG